MDFVMKQALGGKYSACPFAPSPVSALKMCQHHMENRSFYQLNVFSVLIYMLAIEPRRSMAVNLLKPWMDCQQFF